MSNPLDPCAGSEMEIQMEIQLKLTVVRIDTPEQVAILQSRIEEVVKLFPHYYAVFQNSGIVQEILATNVASDVETIITPNNAST